MECLTNYVSLPDSSFEAISFIIVSALKTSLLLLFVLTLCRIFHSFSAATRHFLWSLALIASFIIPVLSVVKAIKFPILPFQISASNQSQISPVKVNLQTTGEFLNDKASIQSGPPSYSQYQTSTSTPAGSKTGNKTVDTPSDSLTTGFAKTDNVMSILQQASGWLFGVWLVGVMMFLLKLSSGLFLTNRLVKESKSIDDAEWQSLFSMLSGEMNLKGKISLRRSHRINMPVVCGFRNAVILLPAVADKWSAERRRVVLLHELAHVLRRDCLAQMIAHIACAFYWFNPLVWYAARRMQIERERACDDRVLSAGTAPSDYAQHLLEIAYSLRDKNLMFDWSEASSVALARKSQIEERLRAILDFHLTRLNPGRAAKMSLAVAFLTVIFSLSALQFISEAQAVAGMKKREEIDLAKDDYKNSSASLLAMENRNEYVQFQRRDKVNPKKKTGKRKESPAGLQTNQTSVKSETDESEISKKLAEQDAQSAGIEQRINRLKIDPQLLEKLKADSKSKVEIIRQKAQSQLDEFMSKEGGN